MINVNEVKEFVDFMLNKDQSGNSYTPDQFNMLLRRATDAQFKKEYGLPEDYKPGYPLPNIAWELTQKIMDDLRTLKEKVNLPVNSDGEMNLPLDYIHVSRIRYNKATNNADCTGVTLTPRAVEVVPDLQWDVRVSASIKKPSYDFPIANINSNYIQFEPKDLSTIELVYLRYPKVPIWAYNVVGDVAIYDPINSVNIELPEIQTNNIAEILLSYIGINLRETDLYQYAQSKTVNGI